MQKTGLVSVKLIISVLAAILLFFALIVKGTSDIISYNVRNETYDHYAFLSNDTAERINAWLSSKKEIIDNQRASIESIGNFDPGYLSSFLSSAVMGRSDHNEICDLYFVSPDNTLTTANGYYTAPEIDLRERWWYQSCLVSRSINYSSPYIDLSTGSYVMTISAAINDSHGKFMGVLALDIYTDAFLNTTNIAGVPANSYIFLVDGDLGIASHPNPEYGFIDGKPLNLRDIPDGRYNELVRNIQRTRSTRIELKDYDGVDRDMFTSIIDCCGWYVVTAISDSVLHRSEHILVWTIIAALFVSLAVGIIWTFIGSRAIMRQLGTAMEAANAANETKSSFLANMSHEIRTPINAVIGMNEMILQEDISESVREYSLDIAVASRSLIGIINDILDFSKIESGKLEIIENEFELSSMINDIVSLSVSRLGEKPLDLFVHADPEMPSLLVGDEIRLKQIIVNLMTNGIKYTNKGYVELDIECSPRDYGVNLDIKVKDTGIGITPENIEKLFTSFQRVDTKRNRSVEGTGLGLAISKRLAESMGGFINVSSEFGKGSEFRISIPLKVADKKRMITVRDAKDIHAVCLFGSHGMMPGSAEEYLRLLTDMRKQLGIDMRFTNDIDKVRHFIDEGLTNMLFTDRYNYICNEHRIKELSGRIRVFLVQSRVNPVKTPAGIQSIYLPFYSLSVAAAINNDDLYTVSAGTPAGFTAPDARVLIVDDNLINLKVAVGIMKPYNMNVSVAESGAKALWMVDHEPHYNIVFMDHMMPKMDGVETTAKIRMKGGDYFGKLPIVALTANTVNNARKMFLENGFDDFLAKPIDTGALDRILRAYLPNELMIVSEEPQIINESDPTAAVQSDNSEGLFDPAAGIRYTGGNEELYGEILSDYVRDSEKTKAALRGFRDDGNIGEYIIAVHALKSVSLNVGAVKLSELAKTIELAGKAGNTEIIAKRTDELLELYDKVTERAAEYLEQHGISVTPETPSDSSELTDIDSGKLNELIDSVVSACENFDRDAAAAAADEACGYRYDGIGLADVFGQVKSMIDDFDYDGAAELAASLREGDADE
ncbi:MAG: response regulator [Ruminiclostridium sp.]|nr:response regulator [Ruminiclostridium sp.]